MGINDSPSGILNRIPAYNIAYSYSLAWKSVPKLIGNNWQNAVGEQQ